MSMAPFFGVPGKLKSLLDRLTATRAGNLDNLNATISSRAPASTAVSTANLTNGRIGNLDNLNTTVSSRATQASVDAINTAPLSDSVSITVTAASSTGGQDVPLGRAFDIARSIVQVDSAGALNGDPDVYPIFRWRSTSELQIRFIDPATGSPSNEGGRTFNITVLEFRA